MRSIILIFTTILLIHAENALPNKKLSCSDFKIGKFQLINKSSNLKYLLLRTKDFQIEQTFDLKTNKKTKKDRYYKISWKNECEYNLMVDFSKNGINENDTYLNSKGGLKCSIKKIENNCATVDTYFDGDVLSSKICKLND